MSKTEKRKAEERQLIGELQEASSVFQNDPSQQKISTLNVLKEKMEQMYDKKVESSMVRSRRRWYERTTEENILNNSVYFRKM